MPACEPSIERLVVTGPIATLTQGPLARRFGEPLVSQGERTATVDSLASMVMAGLLRE